MRSGKGEDCGVVFLNDGNFRCMSVLKVMVYE
jgi:hypothetical protein